MQITGWDVAVVVAKALGYATTLCAAGAVFFLAYSDSLLSPAQRASIRSWIWPLSLASLAASAVKVMLLAGSMSGALWDMFDPSFNSMILRAGEGWSVGVRAAGIGLACAALTLKPSGRFWASAGAACAAASFGLTGHAHALPHPGPAVALLMLHLLCAAFWLGALAPLYRFTGDEHDAVRGGDLAARFGTMAAWVVAALLTAGAGLLCLLLDSASSLWSGGYGRMMLLKLLLVAALLAFAALNKWRLTPGLRDNTPRAAEKLRRSIALEMLLAGAILLITAAFTTLSGPKS